MMMTEKSNQLDAINARCFLQKKSLDKTVAE